MKKMEDLALLAQGKLISASVASNIIPQTESQQDTENDDNENENVAHTIINKP